MSPTQQPPEDNILKHLKAAQHEIEQISQTLHCYHIKFSFLPIPRLALDLLGAARHVLRTYHYFLEMEIVKRSDRFRT